MLRSNGESLLHMLAREGLEEAGLFLTTQSVNCNVMNADGETPLHVSCTVGLPSLTTALLQVSHYLFFLSLSLVILSGFLCPFCFLFSPLSFVLPFFLCHTVFLYIFIYSYLGILGLLGHATELYPIGGTRRVSCLVLIG